MKWQTELIKRLNEYTSLRAIVGGHIYPAYLASITSPQFPCIAFYNEGGSRRVPYLRHATMSVRFWAYSMKSFEQARQIFDLVVTRLNSEAVISEEDGTLMFSLMTEPVELHDEQLKGITGAFVVRRN